MCSSENSSQHQDCPDTITLTTKLNVDFLITLEHRFVIKNKLLLRTHSSHDLNCSELTLDGRAYSRKYMNLPTIIYI